MFVVFGETAVSTKPGEGALDHPTLWQHVEALGGGVPGNGDQKAVAERLAGGLGSPHIQGPVQQLKGGDPVSHSKGRKPVTVTWTSVYGVCA